VLYPDAFSNEGQLVRTLGHERVHAYQAMTLGAPRNSIESIAYEQAAIASEEDWWQFYLAQP